MSSCVTFLDNWFTHDNNNDAHVWGHPQRDVGQGVPVKVSCCSTSSLKVFFQIFNQLDAIDLYNNCRHVCQRWKWVADSYIYQNKKIMLGRREKCIWISEAWLHFLIFASLSVLVDAEHFIKSKLVDEPTLLRLIELPELDPNRSTTQIGNTLLHRWGIMWIMHQGLQNSLL